MMNIRKGKEEDIDAIVENAGYAYGIPDDALERIRVNIQELGYVDEYYVAEKDGKIAAQARLIPLKQNIRGVMKNMGGVTMVASLPEYRRRGYVRNLILKMSNDFHQDYSTFTLYPFKDTFYSALGYVKMPPLFSIEINPKQLANWKLPDGYHVRQLEIEEGFDDLREIHDSVVPPIHGGVRRYDRRWEEFKKKFRGNLAVAYGPDSNPQGYMFHKNKGYGGFSSSDKVGTMYVREVFWKNHLARAALLNFISLHVDQIVKAKIPITPQSADFYHYAEDINVPVVVARLITMASTIDVRNAIEGIPVADEGEVTIKVSDNRYGWNNQVFKISGVQFLSAEAIDQAETDIKITIEGLTSLIYGSLSTKQLVGLGMISGEQPKILDRWFPKLKPWLSEYF